MKNSPPRQKILVVTHGDGFVEVFAEAHVDVKIIEQPRMTTAEGERQAEEYVDLSLPRRYQNLFWPDKRRAVDVIEDVTPSELARREGEREVSACLDRVARILSQDDEEDDCLWTS